jgi:hypothetical protein
LNVLLGSNAVVQVLLFLKIARKVTITVLQVKAHVQNAKLAENARTERTRCHVQQVITVEKEKAIVPSVHPECTADHRRRFVFNVQKETSVLMAPCLSTVLKAMFLQKVMVCANCVT